MATAIKSPSLAKQHPAITYLLPLLEAKQFTPTVCIVCGSGLSHLDEHVDVESRLVVKYGDLPGFPPVSVIGHAGELVFGKLKGMDVMIVRGRFHSYEGHAMDVVTLPVRVAAALKCKFLIVTNASGGINSSFAVGDIMIMSDHIGIPLLAGKGPLVGPNDDVVGTRFPSVSDAYDVQLRNLANSCALDLGMSSFVKSCGTYVMVSGPQYETAAECVMLRNWGCDAVGMSTVPEVVVAKHAGMRILGISLICNKVILPGDSNRPPASHAEVMATTVARSKDVQKLVETILQRIPTHLASTPTTITTQMIVAHDVPNKPFSTGRERAGSATDSTHMVISRLRELDITSLTPLQSLKILSEMKSAVGG